MIDCLGIAGTILEALLYVLLASRPINRRKFQSFTVYVGILACSDLFLFYVRSELGSAEYFWSWWAQFAVLSVAKIFVLFDVFGALFSPFWTIPSGPIRLFIGALAVAALAVIAYAFFSPAVYLASWLRVLRTFGRSVNLYLCFSIWFLILFVSYFRMPCSKKLIGLLTGLCVELSAVSIISAIQAAQNHSWVHAAIAPIEMTVWLAVIAIWISSFAREDKGVVNPSPEILERIRVLTTNYRASLNRVSLYFEA